MRRLLGSILISWSLLACGGDDSGLFDNGVGGAAGGGAGSLPSDSGQHADSGSTQAGGASGSASNGSDSGAPIDASDASVASDVVAQGEEDSPARGDTTGIDTSDVSVAPDATDATGIEASDVSVAPDATDAGVDRNEAAIPDSSAADSGDADATYCSALGIGTPCDGGFCNASGNCVQCLAPSDCGASTACSSPTCDNGTCGVSYKPVDFVLPTQTTGDCKVKVCATLGATKDNNDDSDKPNDGNDCTDDTCNAGVPVHTVLTGNACGTNGLCNDQGACVGCNVPADCAGVDDYCKTRTCVSNTCGVDLKPVGTELPAGQQTDKDCKKKVCDANGNVQTADDPSDPPIDANECTVDTCSGPTPQNTFADPGTSCSTGVCDGAGACVECLSPANCPATGNVCTMATCDGSHHCGTANNPPDTTCGVGPSCNLGQGHLQDKCSSGACVPGASVMCSPYACGASACKTGCSGDGDCASGYSCDTDLAVCTDGPKCTEYCDTIMSACTGGNAQYFSKAVCLKSCATLPRGTLGDGNNSVGCRITHAGYAVSTPDLHCPHAGPGGDGVCSTSNCDGFCTIALGICTGPNQVWATKNACMTDCATYNATPPYNASITSGNTFACRMYYLTAAAGTDPNDPVVHCPHIQIASSVCQ